MAKKSSKPDDLSPLKRALVEIRELRTRVAAHDQARTEPIAVIGLGMRFPGKANDPESYWALLRDGVDAIDEVPADRWDIDAFYDPDPDAVGKISSRWGGFVDSVDEFDPDFFGISPREAEAMDPQQRLLLEVSWEALEHAGQSTDRLQTTPTGVFVGIGTSDYAQLQAQFAGDDRFDTYFATGSVSHSVASGRLAYVFGLRGPTLSVDTACSASLMSVHLACQSLRLGECEMALAGGVNVVLAPENCISLSRAHMMAADGRCKTFDARADGFVRAEGCGIIVLKRLSDAQRDNDNILCVIRGSATNQDGRSQGLTAPNGPSQEAVVRLALKNAEVDPGDVSLIETHGTGTALGDPIEIHALDGVFKDNHAKDNPLLIGSVKTNIGHLETAAGIASLIKVVLALMQKQIPPSLHFDTPNPHISWDQSCTEVVTNLTPWDVDNSRIAGVSSFGFSGTNVHVILEEMQESETPKSEYERPLHVMSVSARCEEALQDQLNQYAAYIRNNPSGKLPDIAYTANTGRSHFEHRAAVICSTGEKLGDDLSAIARGEPVVGAYKHSAMDSGKSRVVFLFTGQGAQYAEMGRALYESQPTFRSALNQCNEVLEEHLEESLLDVMLRSDFEEHLQQTAYTQPALFALEYALACLWRSWGVEPAAVIGHSVGEYVAACIAGVFSIEDGLKIIAARARLMQDLPAGGAMLAVLSSKDKLEPMISPHLSDVGFAGFNAPEVVVVSGARAAIDDIHAQCSQQEIETKYLEVSHAFHSTLMEPMVARFAEILEQVNFNAPRLPLISNINGQAVGAKDVDADYWCRHILEPVQFAAGINTLWEMGHRIYLELGPTPTLCGLGQQNLIDQDALWLPSLRAGIDDWQQILETLSQLYVRGNNIDWRGFDRDYVRRHVTLPNYPFQRERFWFEPRAEPHRGLSQADAWQALLAAGRRQSEQVPIDLALHTYAAKWECLNDIATAYMIRTLRRLGAYTKAGESHSVGQLMAEFDITSTYQNLILRWLTHLSSEGILQREGEDFSSPKTLPDQTADALFDEARTILADIPFILEYIERCGSMLESVLTGKESPLETLFPGGSFDLADHIYKHWAISRYSNAIVRAVFEASVSGVAPGKCSRILEIGAGTGGTTSAVLPALPSEGVTYHYTDLSEVFLAGAREKFQAYPFIHFGLLDIENEPQTQGYGPHDFDIVLAANVLHATRNLENTIDNVLSLLAPGACLVLFETVYQPTWFDISFGLIEGWQQFEDDIRDDNPLLAVEQWRELLMRKGFEEVVAFPESAIQPDVIFHRIMVARAPSFGLSIERHSPPPQKEAQPGAQTMHELGTTGEAAASSFMEELRELSADKCRRVLVDYVRSHVNTVLRRDPAKALDRRKRLMDLGIDSLMAVELRNRLTKGLGLEQTLPATLMFDYPTVEAIATYLGKEVLDLEEKATESAHVKDEALRASELEKLSDSEMENLLVEKLKEI